MHSLTAMLTQSLPLHRQVEDYVRQRIQSGEYGPGSKLPSTPMIAKLTGTSVFTVQTALARLAKEGLLIRRARHATYVKGDKPVLTCAGLYFNLPFFRADSSFYRVLGQELQRKLAAQGVKTRVWSDDRDELEQNEPLAQLKQAIDKREIQALIAPLICGNDLNWLKKLPIPAAINSIDLSLNNSVWVDYRNMLRLGMEELRRQGCRTVGMISNSTLRPSRELETDFYRYLVEVTNELGLEIRNQWIRFPAQYTPHFANFGYEQFHALWNLENRPEGLLVYSDVTATGVITAIMESRISVPTDLKVVFHANDLLPYPCPLPASLLMTNVGKYADAMIEIVQKQLAGEEVHSIQIPMSLITTSNTLSPTLKA